MCGARLSYSADLSNEFRCQQTEDGIQESSDLLNEFWSQEAAQRGEKWANVGEKWPNGIQEIWKAVEEGTETAEEGGRLGNGGASLVYEWRGKEGGGVVDEAFNVIEGLGVQELQES